MITSPSKSSTWDETCRFEDDFSSQNGIATESQTFENPEWGKCIDALLKAWNEPCGLGETPPNKKAIRLAMEWAAELKKQFPAFPPTCIIPEPNGGIIMERQIRLKNGDKRLYELTFYNNDKAEWTSYLNGKVLKIVPVSKYPQEHNLAAVWA